MERNRCPGCGMPYNGKKCRNCLFQPVKTDLTTVSTGKEPKPASPANGKKQKSALRSLLGLLVILALIALLLPSLRNWGMELKETEQANSSIQIISD